MGRGFSPMEDPLCTSSELRPGWAGKFPSYWAQNVTTETLPESITEQKRKFFELMDLNRAAFDSNFLELVVSAVSSKLQNLSTAELPTRNTRPSQCSTNRVWSTPYVPVNSTENGSEDKEEKAVRVGQRSPSNLTQNLRPGSDIPRSATSRHPGFIPQKTPANPANAFGASIPNQAALVNELPRSTKVKLFLSSTSEDAAAHATRTPAAEPLQAVKVETREINLEDRPVHEKRETTAGNQDEDMVPQPKESEPEEKDASTRTPKSAIGLIPGFVGPKNSLLQPQLVSRGETIVHEETLKKNNSSQTSLQSTEVTPPERNSITYASTRRRQKSHPLTGTRVSFQEFYNRLAACKNQQGHVTVYEGSDVALQKWMNAVRQAGSMGKLSATRRRLLDDLGFEWHQIRVQRFRRFMRTLRKFCEDVDPAGYPHWSETRHREWFEATRERYFLGKLTQAKRVVLQRCALFMSLLEDTTLSERDQSSPLRLYGDEGDSKPGSRVLVGYGLKQSPSAQCIGRNDTGANLSFIAELERDLGTPFRAQSHVVESAGEGHAWDVVPEGWGGVEEPLHIDLREQVPVPWGIDPVASQLV